MKCCFIGSNGFLATAFGNYFNKKEGYKIDVIAKNKPNNFEYHEFFQVDVTKKFEIETLLKYDFIFYFIGKGIQNNNIKNDFIEDIYLTNSFTPIKILLNLNELNYNGVFISFGSYFEIGQNKEIKSFKEHEILYSSFKVPTDYCKSKRLLSRFIDSSNYNYKMWHFFLPTIYGETENQNRLIPYIVKSIKSNSIINVTSADQVREYIYVNEIPEIIYKSIKCNLDSGCFNISGSEVKSIRGLILEIANTFGYPENKILYGTEFRNDTQMKHLELNGEKLQSLILYKPKEIIINQLIKYWNGL